MVFTDFKNTHWTQEKLPPFFRPYAALARLDRPVGTWLLFLPAVWGVLLAHSPRESWFQIFFLLILFGIGSLLLRSFGCVVNDLWDRDIDRQVERTKGRPLASGQISVLSAFLFAGGLLFLGFFILISFNPLTITLGVSSLLFVVIYPLMKRFFPWPQAFLGMTFNFGALMGWTAVRETLEWAPFLLYVGGLFWTLSYDTIYALLDYKEDSTLNIRSTAVSLGKGAVSWSIAFLGMSVFLIGFAAYCAGARWIFFVFLIGAFGYALWNTLRVERDDRSACLRCFVSHPVFGQWIAFGMALDLLFR